MKIMALFSALVIILAISIPAKSPSIQQAEQHFEKGNELLKRKDYQVAIAEYGKVIDLSSDSKVAQDAQYWIGQCYFKSGQFDAAISAFQKLLDEYPTSTIVPSTQLMIERVHQVKNRESLFEAVNKGDIEQLKLLISEGADVNIRDQKDMTPLHLTAGNGNTDIASILIDNGADVNTRIDEYGVTPLHVAAVWGKTAVAELLLAKGADINAQTRRGETALEFAIRNDHPDVLELLLANGANIEARNNSGETPLWYAVWYDKLEMVKLLIKKGAYIDAQDYTEHTPLHLAVTNRNQDMVELLLANGAAPWRRCKDFNLIGTAMAESEKGMINFLIAKNFEHSKVHIEAFFGNTDEIENYLTAGGDINAKDSSKLTLLVCAILGRQTALVEFLISKGADINLKSAEGMTALHWTMMRGNPEIARMLLDKGADITITDDYGCTALFYTPRKDIAEMMIAKGADVNARSGVIFVYRDSKSDEGWTPLHMACRRINKTVVEVLIANGADVNAESKNGKTAISVVKEGPGHVKDYDKQIIELLRKHGAKE